MNDMAVRVAFANAVKLQRNRLGISQEELAERAMLHRTYISDVERAARNLSLSSITKLATALDISIPALFAATDMPDAQAPEQPADCRAGEPVEIVLIEDDPGDEMLTLRAFQRSRFANRVHVIRDGQTALDQLLGEAQPESGACCARAHMILLDLALPKVDGMEVLRRLKGDRRTQAIPVVILTGSSKSQDIAECLRLGAAAYLVKPVDFRGLAKVTPDLKLDWVLTKSAAPACA